MPNDSPKCRACGKEIDANWYKYLFTIFKGKIPLNKFYHEHCQTEDSSKTTERQLCLEKASEAVLQDRNIQYGPPENSFERIAVFWQIFMPRHPEQIMPHHVAMAMIALKLVRLMESPGHFDSWVDIAGYAACGWECSVEEKK